MPACTEGFVSNMLIDVKVPLMYSVNCYDTFFRMAKEKNKHKEASKRALNSVFSVS